MFRKSFIVIALIWNIIIVKSDEDRKQSVFKVGPGSDDWLALPEVFSNLDFTADSTPAKEEDIEGQLRLRATRFWGRLYLDGWPQTIQYFRAHFGIEPPIGRKTFVFAEPRDACQELTNAHLLTSDHVLLVNRGSCTFGSKAKFAQKTNATAIIIINNEPGIDHLPGPDAHDIQYSIVSIAQQEGQLIEAVYDDGPVENGFGRKIEGYIIPINCEHGQTNCVPATYEERKATKSLIDGGVVLLHPTSTAESYFKDVEFPIEYLISHFGTKAPHVSKEFIIELAKPPDACGPLENDVKGKAVLVRRGTCPFVKKAESVQNAGGTIMIVGSLNSYIVRMGVEPRWKGLNTVIPVVMVSKRAYSVLVAEAAMATRVSFNETNAVSGQQWEVLEKLVSGEGWPRSESYIEKKYIELLAENKEWPDRIQTLHEAYNIKTNSTKKLGNTSGQTQADEPIKSGL